MNRKKEIVVRIEGHEKIKVGKCKHKHPVFVYNEDGNWVYCEDCGLRTPVTDQVDVMSAEIVFAEAEKKGELYRDFTHLKKVYFLDEDKNKITSSLCYSSEGNEDDEGHKDNKEKVKLNQEAIQICPVCEKRRMVVWYGELTQGTKLFCLECGHFWMEREDINKDPQEYIDWKIREFDKKVQEMVEDVKSELVNNKKFCFAVGEEEDTYGKYLDAKNKRLDEEVEDIVRDAIKDVNTACILSGIPCDPDTSDAIKYIESCLEKSKTKKR